MPEHCLPPAGPPSPEAARPSHPLDELDALAASGPRQRNAWALWLFVVVLVVVVPPVYNHRNPMLLGVPIFVWYQFAAVIFGAAVTGLIYVLRGTTR